MKARKDRGFTLIELLVVISIIVIAVKSPAVDRTFHKWAHWSETEVKAAVDDMK